MWPKFFIRLLGAMLALLALVCAIYITFTYDSRMGFQVEGIKFWNHFYETMLVRLIEFYQIKAQTDFERAWPALAARFNDSISDSLEKTQETFFLCTTGPRFVHMFPMIEKELAQGVEVYFKSKLLEIVAGILFGIFLVFPVFGFGNLLITNKKIRQAIHNFILVAVWGLSIVFFIERFLALEFGVTTSWTSNNYLFDLIDHQSYSYGTEVMEQCPTLTGSDFNNCIRRIFLRFFEVDIYGVANNFYADMKNVVLVAIATKYLNICQMVACGVIAVVSTLYLIYHLCTKKESGPEPVRYEVRTPRWASDETHVPMPTQTQVLTPVRMPVSEPTSVSVV